jgi:magnesium and cobalt transporter
MTDIPEGGQGAAGAASTPDPEDQPGSPGLLERVASIFKVAAAPAAPLPAAAPPAATAGQPALGNLRRMRVEDVAIPRIEITAVPVDIGFDDLVRVFRESGNTRLPVYDGTLDGPLGLIHLKDFALTHGFKGHEPPPFDLRAMLRPLLYAPPSMPIGVLLQKMQTDRVHMALVIDEYGGVDGLVTIEDLLEQVVGEIEDEHDVAEAALWTEEKPGCYLALARTPLEEFEAAIGLKLADEEDGEEIDTLGGLVFMEIGRVPTRGEVIAHRTGVQFEVVDADPRRIKRLRVRMPGVKAAPSGAPRAQPDRTLADKASRAGGAAG